MTEKFSTLIPESYLDIICRVVPGGLIIFLWFKESYFTPVNNLFAFKLPAILAIAWLLGLLVETATHSLVFVILKGINHRLSKSTKPKSTTPAATGKDVPKSRSRNLVNFILGEDCWWPKKSSPLVRYDMHLRRLLQRMMAEVILLRSLAAIAFFCGIFATNCEPPAWTAWFQNYYWLRIALGAFLSCLLIISWGVKHYHLFYVSHDNSSKANDSCNIDTML